MVKEFALKLKGVEEQDSQKMSEFLNKKANQAIKSCHFKLFKHIDREKLLQLQIDEFNVKAMKEK